ncbi:hypothetical protein ABENE_05355 [Asticcacaulis benevestitus DSM 16100 = ATCC BAA-896]|uniref:Polysaccharide biosynthesis protein GumN n=2 Tax=Asticcacaulis TaxID=76890 RepID=V4Q242_9CAUL|nr:hypothetical protein ABENE_05355 [Asticcacaulis benevestitus DSM 16100 = ATCC BAA-896]
MLLAASAHAQDSAQTPEPQAWSDVTEVVVRAKVAGPAMWKLTRGQSSVWVLGTLAETPENLTWDTTRVKRLLKGAHYVIVPGASRGGDIAGKRWLKGSELPSGTYLYDLVPPAAYARFEKVVAHTSGLRASDYAYKIPMRAGMELFSDVLAANHIRRYDIMRQVTALAANAGVASRIAYTVNADTLSDQWLKLDAGANRACFNTFLDGIDYNLTVLPGMAQAWAQGDVKTALSQYRESALLTCNLSTPEWGQQYDALFIGGMTTAIEEALKTPGKSLAVVPFSDLLRKDGVLDRLRAAGVVVTSPAQ